MSRIVDQGWRHLCSPVKEADTVAHPGASPGATAAQGHSLGGPQGGSRGSCSPVGYPARVYSLAPQIRLFLLQTFSILKL